MLKRLYLVLVIIYLGVAAPAQAQPGTNNDVLNPNQVGEEELKALPHVTDALAASLMENRPYLSMLAVDALISKSLDEAEREALYVKLFLPINLNTASREEILLVPGVGARMAHEFEEYRPYRALAQFQREMGKYVDDDEVARMEQYVFIPIDLNSASDEDILSIPGLGQRMLREFKEYRPYKNIEQFRREMGKYVDEKEVARLERYVIIGEN